MSAHSISKKAAWLSVKNYFNADSPTELLIVGQIGKDWWTGDGVAEKEFIDALKDIPEGKPIVVGINSEGGSVKDGLGIYHALRRRGDSVTTRIDGYAVSIASVIALAGAKRVSPDSSIWMIHEPWSMVAGDAETMRKEATALDAHADAIAAVYVDRTKLSAEDARAKMRAETWFRGSEAVSMGFATEAGAGTVALNAFDATKFRNCPKDVLHNLAAAQGQQNTPASVMPDNAAAQSSGTPPEPQTTNNQGTTMEPNTTAPAAPNTAAVQPAPTQTANSDNASVVINLQNQIADLQSTVRAMQNPPITRSVITGTNVVEGLNDHLASRCKTHKERFAYMRDHWSELQRAYPLIQNANTDTAAGALTPGILADGFITVLQNRLAPLTAFTRNFTAAATAGKRNVIEVPIVTAGGTAQSNATSFEDTTNFVGTVDDIPITPAQITVGAHITNAEQQNGWLMGWWTEIKAAEMADKIQTLVNAIITTANFTATPVTASAAAFKANGDLKTLWGQLKKSPVKNILLDGEYFAQFLPDNLESFNPLNSNAYPGWDGFFCNTNWTGATANTVGFACNPSAIAVGSALPAELPSMAGAAIARSTVTVPFLGLTVASYTWFSTSTRTGWWTMDVMFGAAKGDPNAGILVKSA